MNIYISSVSLPLILSEALVRFHKMHIWLHVLQQINKHVFRRKKKREKDRGGDGTVSVLKTDERGFTLMAYRRV